jgi:hypothetical protein
MSTSLVLKSGDKSVVPFVLQEDKVEKRIIAIDPTDTAETGKKKKTENQSDWKAVLKSINRAVSPPLFYVKFTCKVATHAPETKKLVAPIKQLIKYPGRLLQTIKLVLGLSSFSSKKIKLDLKSTKELLSLFNNTIKFGTMIADSLSLKVSSKITKVNIALSTILPFLNFYTKITNKKSSRTDISMAFYKVCKSLLSIYLLVSMSKINKTFDLALTVTDFALAHI